MRYLSLVLGFVLVILVFMSGCSSPLTSGSSTRSAVSTPFTPEPTITIDSSTITHAELILVPEKWDSDAKYDGFMLSIALLDKDNNSVFVGKKLNFPLDIEKWTSKAGWNVYANTTLEKVDQSHEAGNTRVSGNTRLRIEYDPPTNDSSSMGILIKVHLPDGRTIESTQQTSMPPNTG
jgi:hypothetical protein